MQFGDEAHQALIATHAPMAIQLADLAGLGPVTATVETQKEGQANVEVYIRPVKDQEAALSARGGGDT